MRRESLLRADEVSIIRPEEYGSGKFSDILFAKRLNEDNDANPFSYINSNHASYLPLHYIRLFPYGQAGWYWGSSLDNCEEKCENKNLSQWIFYRFHLHTRPNEPSTLFLLRILFQQCVVDA